MAPFAPADGSFLAGIAIWIGVTVVTLLLFYWIIRLAVWHAPRDAEWRQSRGSDRRSL